MTGDYLIPVHVNETVGTKQKRVVKKETTVHYLNIYNSHATNTLSVSFNGGSDFRQIAAGGDLELSEKAGKPIYLNEGIKVKGSAASTTLEIIMLK